jgi:hypothetical protein
MKELLERNVPEGSLVYLTRSESEAKTVGKQFGAYAGGVVGGAAGMSAGVAAAVLLAVPGIGPVFALGFGAAALLGLVGAGTGSKVGASIAEDSEAPSPTSGTGSSSDVAFFQRSFRNVTLQQFLHGFFGAVTSRKYSDGSFHENLQCGR